ncbi:MAG: hypothetical protein GY729_02215 [Desulfobacteraceae bacterium]|nr:hypothetical protein [Desulfobacteraceae bacterium]
MSTRNLLLSLVFFMFLAVINGCANKNYELNRNDYTLDELYEMITALPSSSLRIIRHPNPKVSSDTGYSYFYENDGKNINLGKRFDKDHEIRFDEGDSGDRFFRDKNGIVKIIGGYSPITEDEPFDLSGIFSEISGDVVVDKLTATDGYIVFLVKTNYPEDLPEKEYYLMIAIKVNVSFSASISRSLFTKAELERMDSSIRRGPEVWEKYFRAEPPGKYLPGSGPGEGFRPGSGEVKAPYGPKQDSTE